MSKSLKTVFDKVDIQIVGWMEHYGRFLLRIALGIIFFWFGVLKIFGMSPAAELVARTVYWFDPVIFVPVLGWWEALIGIGLWIRPMLRVTLFLLFVQMMGTMLPLVLLPEVCFVKFPFVLTLEGQYIIKNLVLIGAAIVVGGTLRKQYDIWV